MTQRPLGQSGLSVRPFVLGGNVFGMTADRAASFAILDRFVERGGGMIDTADVYSAWVPGHKGGESESMNRRAVSAPYVSMMISGSTTLRLDLLIFSIRPAVTGPLSLRMTQSSPSRSTSVGNSHLPFLS